MNEDNPQGKFLTLIHKVLKEGKLKEKDTLWTIL